MTLVERRLNDLIAEISNLKLNQVVGRVVSVRGNTVVANLAGVDVSTICNITRQNLASLRAEVIALDGHRVILSTFGRPHEIIAGAEIKTSEAVLSVPVSDALLGRVVDPFGVAVDSGPALPTNTRRSPIRREAPSAMSRPMIERPFESGIRVIDGLATLGEGQRIGVFGPPGTGKTSLMAMLAQNCEADVIVIALVGERGREVREFIDEALPKSARNRVVVVAATSDRPPYERAICAMSATSIAEYFAEQGKNVFLLVDSLTRTARALREIGLEAGEAPARRGYPASVYPALPAIIERAGRYASGNITALYTVLTEGRIESDPIAEEVKSLTDGHLILDRELANRGHYPAIEARESLSRVMSRVASSDHVESARNVREQLAAYADIELLLQVGEYATGSDPIADEAIARRPDVENFLRQAPNEQGSLEETIAWLEKLHD